MSSAADSPESSVTHDRRLCLGKEYYGGMKMEQNVSQNDNQQPCFRKVIGNTTYVVRVHFSETSKETIADKIKRLIGDEAGETD